MRILEPLSILLLLIAITVRSENATEDETMAECQRTLIVAPAFYSATISLKFTSNETSTNNLGCDDGELEAIGNSFREEFDSVPEKDETLGPMLLTTDLCEEVAKPDRSCCSWNARDCDEDEYCSASAEVCLSQCYGAWITPTLCLTDGEVCDPSAPICCEGYICVQADEGLQHPTCAPDPSGGGGGGDGNGDDNGDEDGDERRALTYGENGYNYYQWSGHGSCLWCRSKNSDFNIVFIIPRAGFSGIVEQLERDLNIILTNYFETTYFVDPNSCLYGISAVVTVKLKHLQIDELPESLC